MEFDNEAFFAVLEGLGPDQVRVNLAKGKYNQIKRNLADEWLRRKDEAREAEFLLEDRRLAEESNALARKANEIAQEANSTAGTANRIAIVAAIVSVLATAVAIAVAIFK